MPRYIHPGLKTKKIFSLYNKYLCGESVSNRDIEIHAYTYFAISVFCMIYINIPSFHKSTFVKVLPYLVAHLQKQDYSVV